MKVEDIKVCIEEISDDPSLPSGGLATRPLIEECAGSLEQRW